MGRECDASEGLGTVAGAGNNADSSALKAVGKIDKASGTVQVTHPDGTHGVLHPGDIVYKGDVISTSGDGAVGITFADSSTFSLGKSGKMTIDELVYDPGAQSGQSALSVVKGAFSFASGQIAKTAPDATTIKTPVMTIGIRGTTVAGQADDEGGANSVALLPDADGNVGQVAVFNNAGLQVLSSPLQQVNLFSSLQPPPPPVYVSPASIPVMYGNAIDNRPPAPPPGTAPQQIVPNFQPSAPVQQPSGPIQAPTTPQTTPQPEPRSGGINTDHPVVSYQPPVYVNEPSPTPVPPTLTQLVTAQTTVAQNANNAGASVPVAETGVSGTVAEQSTGPLLEDLRQALTKAADKTAADITNTAGQNNSQGQTGTTGGINNSNNDAVRPNNGNNGNQNNSPSPNGRAIDGYVANATVFRDQNNNSEWDAGEDKTTTDGGGNYYLSGSGGVIVIKGGTDTTTGKPLTFVMKAPAGSSVVTPLTTMVIAIAGPNADASAIAAAEDQVRTSLGLPAGASLTSLDPVASLGAANGVANEIMAAIAKVVSTANTISALTGGGISADAMINFLAAQIGSGNDVGNSLVTSNGLNTLLSNVPGISTYLDTGKLALVSAGLAGSNASLAEEVLSATSYSAVSATISAATSTDGALVSAVQNIVQNNLDIHNTDVVFGNGSTTGVLAQLRAAGITTLTLNSGPNKVISAATAAGLRVSLSETTQVRVEDTGANLSQHVGSLYRGFSAYVVTSGEFHLDRSELANLHVFLSKTGTGTIVCDLSGGDALTLADYPGSLTTMIERTDTFAVAANATVTLDVSVLASGKVTSGANSHIVALADGHDLNLSGITFPVSVSTLHVTEGSTVTLDAAQWKFFTSTGHTLTVDAGGELTLLADGDLTGTNLSKADHVVVDGTNVDLTLVQWDSLRDGNKLTLENNGTVDIVVKANADLSQNHNGLADAIGDGTIAHLTITANTTITFDAATLLEWWNAGAVTLNANADITVRGDVSGFDPSIVSTYFDHVVHTANTPPMGEPAALFNVGPSGGTITIDMHDLDGDSLTYQVTGGTRGGALTSLGDGTFTYTPSQAGGGIETFTITVSDGTHTSTQEIALVAKTSSEPNGVYVNTPPDFIDTSAPGEWVSTGISLGRSGSVSTEAVVTVVVYVTTNGDMVSGTLSMDGEPVGAMWSITAPIGQINGMLEHLQYRSPTSIPSDGSDYINVVVYRNGNTSSTGFSAQYHAPDSFNGHAGTAWEDSGNWSDGLPDGDKAVLLDGDKIAGSEDKVVVNGGNTETNGLFVVNGATLEVRGSLTASGITVIDEDSHLLLTGTGEFVNEGNLNLSGDVTVSGGASFYNAGTIEIGGEADKAPDGSGEGIATVTVVGNVDLDSTDSTIVFEVTENGNGPEHDKLIFANGTEELRGRIEVNVDPLSHYSSSEITLISGISSNDATFAISDNSNDHTVVGLRYDSGTKELIARLESFGDGSTATFSTSAGTDFVFGAKGLNNVFGDPGRSNFIAGSDQITGGNLDDRFYVGADGAWHVEGGSGTDTLVLATGYAYDITETKVGGIEVFEMSGSDVNLTLSHETTATVTGISTQDSVYAGDENDTFVVDSDDFHTLSGGGGFDTFVAKGSDIDLSTAGYCMSGIERLEVNTSTDSQAVRLTLTAAAVCYMNPTRTVSVGFNGGTYTDELFLWGNWIPLGGAGAAYGGGDMTFTADYDNGQDILTATVAVNLPDSGDTLVAASMMGPDGTHVKVVTNTAPSAEMSWDGDSGTDYIVGANLHSNRIGNIGDGDYVYGGGQNDTFTATSGSFGTIAGGNGYDTLVLSGAYSATYDLSQADNVSGIEGVTLETPEGSSVTLKLGAKAVAAMSDQWVHVTYAGATWAMGLDGDIFSTAHIGPSTAQVIVGRDDDYLTAIKYVDGSDTFAVHAEEHTSGSATYAGHAGYIDTVIGAKWVSNVITNIGEGDTVIGGVQNDSFTAAQSGFDEIRGGAGEDTLTLLGGSDYTFGNVSSIEKLVMGFTAPDSMDVSISDESLYYLNGSHSLYVSGTYGGFNVPGWSGGLAGGDLRFTATASDYSTVLGTLTLSRSHSDDYLTSFYFDYTGGLTIASHKAADGSYSASAYADQIFGASNVLNVVRDIGEYDQVTGGNQDDIFYITSANFTSIAGKNGNDTLVLDADGRFDIPGNFGRLQSIENIELGKTNTLSLSAGSFGGHENQTVHIIGGSEDKLELTGFTASNADSTATTYTGTNNEGYQITLVVDHAIQQPVTSA